MTPAAPCTDGSVCRRGSAVRGPLLPRCRPAPPFEEHASRAAPLLFAQSSSEEPSATDPLLLVHCDSAITWPCASACASSRQRRRASSLRSRAHVVRMHRMQRLRPSGASAGRPEQSSRRPRPRRLPARGSGKVRKAARGARAGAGDRAAARDVVARRDHRARSTRRGARGAGPAARARPRVAARHLVTALRAGPLNGEATLSAMFEEFPPAIGRLSAHEAPRGRGRGSRVAGRGRGVALSH